MLFIGPISYGIVEPWEGILTFLFFPATVWTAYVAERRLFCYKYMSKSYRAGETHQLLYHFYIHSLEGSFLHLLDRCVKMCSLIADFMKGQLKDLLQTLVHDNWDGFESYKVEQQASINMFAMHAFLNEKCLAATVFRHCAIIPFQTVRICRYNAP